jgi:hypothetical protein
MHCIPFYNNEMVNPVTSVTPLPQMTDFLYPWFLFFLITPTLHHSIFFFILLSAALPVSPFGDPPPCFAGFLLFEERGL